MALGRAEVSIPPRDFQTGGESFDIPLERPRVRLVKVVDIEEQISIWGCEASKVHQVGVAAELDVESTTRHARKV